MTAMPAEETLPRPLGQAVAEPGFIDTHCHLFLMEGEPQDLVEEARLEGVHTMVCVGVDPETSRRSREIADGVAGVFATAGLHPNEASDWDAEGGRVIEELLADPRVVAVGETGLDYYRKGSPIEDQHRVFRAHCGLARETGKAIVVHSREAWEDMVAILDAESVERVVLHCFSGDEAQAVQAGERGWFCSFAANVTYPKNEHLRRAAAAILPELLLTETDSPFLAPSHLRGTDNRPGNVRSVVEILAEVRGADPAGIAALTSENARRAFGLPR